MLDINLKENGTRKVLRKVSVFPPCLKSVKITPEIQTPKKRLTQKFANPPLKGTRAQGWCGNGAHMQVTAAPQHSATARLLESWDMLLLWPSLLYPTEGVSVRDRDRGCCCSGDSLVTAVVIGSVGVWWLWGPCSEGWSCLEDVVTGKRFAAEKLRGVNKIGERVVADLLWEHLPPQVVCYVSKNSCM